MKHLTILFKKMASKECVHPFLFSNFEIQTYKDTIFMFASFHQGVYMYISSLKYL